MIRTIKHYTDKTFIRLIMQRAILLAILIPILLVSCGERSSHKTTVQSSLNNKNKTMAATNLTAAEFRDKVFDYTNATEWSFKGNKPCIIDFSASWCGPCQRLAPVLEEVAQEFEGKIDVYKIDIDEESEVAEQFGIQSVPTLIFCPLDGKPRSTVGLLPKQTIVSTINEVLEVR